MEVKVLEMFIRYLMGWKKDCNIPPAILNELGLRAICLGTVRTVPFASFPVRGVNKIWYISLQNDRSSVTSLSQLATHQSP